MSLKHGNRQPDCPECADSRLLIEQRFDTKLRIGFYLVAVPCPRCRPHLQPPPPLPDFKMAAAGGDR